MAVAKEEKDPPAYKQAKIAADIEYGGADFGASEPGQVKRLKNQNGRHAKPTDS
jgi:hypothetical protein